MTTVFYTLPHGLLLRVIDKTENPQERAERLMLASRRRFLLRRVQDRQPRLISKGGKR